MEENELINELRKCFKFNDEELKNGHYIFECDINDIDIIKYKFVTTVYPHQWWGNIVNPKIVFLALNPGYSKGADELDSAVFENIIMKNYKLENNIGQNVFNNKNLGYKDLSFDYSSTYKWWRNIFDGIIPEDWFDNDVTMEIFNKNVAFFNLVGYQSENTSSLYKKCKSTKLIAKYVNLLAREDKNRLFIFIWGKDDWDKIIVNNKINNFIEINKNDNKNRDKEINKRNKSIKNKILKEDYAKLRELLFKVGSIKEKDYDFLKDYRSKTKEE